MAEGSAPGKKLRTAARDDDDTRVRGVVVVGVKTRRVRRHAHRGDVVGVTIRGLRERQRGIHARFSIPQGSGSVEAALTAARGRGHAVHAGSA